MKKLILSIAFLSIIATSCAQDNEQKNEQNHEQL